MQVFTYSEIIATVSAVIAIADFIRKCINDHYKRSSQSDKNTKK